MTIHSNTGTNCEIFKPVNEQLLREAETAHAESSYTAHTNTWPKNNSIKY